jgi:HSP20 family molecular chaperone IbpA
LSNESKKGFSGSISPYKQYLNLINIKPETELDRLKKIHIKFIEKLAIGANLAPEAKDRILDYALNHCEEFIEIIIGFLDEDFNQGYRGKNFENLDRLLLSLDLKSRKIVRYLIERKHAGIRELADLIEADSDMEILSRIRELINPRSAEFYNHPLLTFHQAKIDTLTGKKVLFKWWISGDVDSKGDEVLIDVFKEDRELRCIVYPPFKVEDLKVQVRGSLLTLRGIDYYKIIQLPYHITEEVERTQNNGVLDIRMRIGGTKK